MQADLEPELERFLEEQVAAGRFGSRSEAVNAAVALLREQAEYRAYVQSAIAEAKASLARGEGQTFTAEELREHFAADRIRERARMRQPLEKAA